MSNRQINAFPLKEQGKTWAVYCHIGGPKLAKFVFPFLVPSYIVGGSTYSCHSSVSTLAIAAQLFSIRVLFSKGV